MNGIREDDLRDALRSAANPPPGVGHPHDLLRRARLGGGRRLARRRVAAAGGMAAVVALVGVGAPVAVHDLRDRRTASAAAVAYGRLAARPTSGNLAGDRDYLRQVIVAWNASHATSVNDIRGIFDDLRGAPHVVWAGTTPAGRAALITQSAFLHRHGNLQLDHPGIHTLVGFVGTGAHGQVTVVGDDYPAPGYPPTVGWFVDPSRRVLAVVDNGEKLSFSPSWTYLPDGWARRGWKPLTFHAGAALITLPKGTNPTEVRITATSTPTADGIRLIAGVPSAPSWIDRRLPWGPASEYDPMVLLPVGDTTHAFGRLDDHAKDLLGLQFLGALYRRTAGGGWGAYGLWYAYGTSSDGHKMIVGERRLGDDASRVYAVLDPGTPTERVVDGGPIDPAAVLPVAIRLPGQGGWVVAAKGARLRYQLRGQPWRDAGRDAAVLPAAANLRVELTAPDGHTRTVSLPR